MAKKIFFGLLLLVLALVGFIYFSSFRINSKEGAYTLEQLSKPLTGSPAKISCPDGTVINAISSGTGPTVILAHGIASTLDSWKIVYDTLVAKGYQVIAFDQRGHGKSTVGTKGINSESMTDDYKHILEFYKVQNGVLLGHSMGGFLAIKYLLSDTAAAKLHIKKAVLLSTFAGDVAKDNPQNKVQIPLINSGAIKYIMNNESMATVFQSGMVAEPYGALIQVALANSKKQDIMTLVPILNAFVDENHYPELGKINVPCVVAVGDKDKTTPAFHSQMLAKGIKNSEFVNIPNSGHLVNWENPKSIVDVIVKAHQ